MALRAYDRDPALPALAGQGHLCPPSADELCALVTQHLLQPGAPAVTGARWDYARWKPGVSISSVFMLRFADGVEEPVVAKRYVDGKDRTITFRPRNEENLGELAVRLKPRALLAERSLSLWIPPADRVLRGLPVLLDKKKLGNSLPRLGILPSGLVKRRKTEYTLLRYKPERRAVYRVDLRLRSEEQKRMALAARALPPPEAARVIESRELLSAAGGAELALPLAGTNLRQGFMLEPWLELEGLADDTFAHAHAAGAQLARLHALTAPTELRKLPTGLPNDLDELFAVDAELARLARAPSHPAPKTRVFCHGDFHPDQVLRRKDGGWLLMDLDCLAAGDPAADLANWIADWIMAQERVAFDEPAAALLDGYCSTGATPPARAHIVAHVAAELVNRAGATLRRLEQGAIPKARFALTASTELARI